MISPERSDPNNHLSAMGDYPRQTDSHSPPTSPFKVKTHSASPSHPLSKGRPTVFGDNQRFDSISDIKSVHEALNGWCGFRANTEALIRVLCHRNHEQLLQIRHDYRIRFDHNLLDAVQSVTRRGDIDRLLSALLTTRAEYYAGELSAALDGLLADDDSLVEILCCLSNSEIRAIKVLFEKAHSKLLESAISAKSYGNFERLLIALCSANRDESTTVDNIGEATQHALQDAKNLQKAGVDRIGTDEAVFIQVLTQRSWPHIQAVCDEYLTLTGHTLRKAIGREFSGSIKMGLTTIVHLATNKDEYFARRLHHSMEGLGTRDSQLIRLIVTRSTIDLADIKDVYQRLFGKSLRSWIKGDTSGSYRLALYHLIGEFN